MAQSNNGNTKNDDVTMSQKQFETLNKRLAELEAANSQKKEVEEGTVVISKEQFEELQNQLKEVRSQALESESNEIDYDSLEEQNAEIKYLYIWNKDGVDYPLIWIGGISNEVRRDNYGRVVVNNSFIEVAPYGYKDKLVKLHYSEDLTDTDNFLNLQKKPFKLTDFSKHDTLYAGASDITPNKIIEDYGSVEVVNRDQSSGIGVATGKKVRGLARADERVYTVLIDGKKVKLVKPK